MAFSTVNTPAALSLPTFLSQINDLGGPARGGRFAVRINPTTAAGSENLLNKLEYSDKIGAMIYVCDTAEFPGRGFSVSEVRYYGAKQVMPHNSDYAPITLSFICRNQSLERQLFDDWMDIINPVSSFHFNYPDEYYCNIDVFQYSEYGKPQAPNSPFPPSPKLSYAWTMYKAWPTLVNPQPATWGDNDILKLQVTFAYKYWDRPNLYKPAESQQNQQPPDIPRNINQLLTNTR